MRNHDADQPVRQPERYEPEVLDRPWGSETIIASTPEYLGKILRMRANTRGGFQLHVSKDETEHLVSGRAVIRYDGGTGTILEAQFVEGTSWHIAAGTPHQVEALTDCLIFEVSTPHRDDRVRLESRYGLPEEPGLPSTRPWP